LRLDPDEHSPLLEGVPPQTTVWMSHGDTVLRPPEGFRVLARTDLCPVAAMAHERRPLFAVQFHPEVSDTPEGKRLLGNFVALTGAARGWNMEAFVGEALESCKAQVGSRNVLMFLSGGVDSTVAFTLLSRALGAERVLGLFINNGFLRKHEAERVLAAYHELGLDHVRYHDASEAFLTAVAGLVDPQEKRHAVGDTFVRVRDDYLAGMNLDPAQWLLGQGTLYPDIIESGGTRHAEVIKSHHNRVQAVRDLMDEGHVVEPLKELYKDEVRELGAVLGLPESIVWRHPFPGPGLSINVLCATGRERFDGLRQTQDALEDLLTGSPFQGAILPVRSVGVQGDQRTYKPPAVLMGPRDWALLGDWSTRVTNGVRAVNRVVTLLSPERLPSLRLHEAYCTRERLALLAEADAIATETLERHGLLRQIFQLLVILLPLSGGASGGASKEGTGESLVLRPVVSEDVMTARFAELPWAIVDEIARALHRLPGVSAVFYDVTHKPPATFGWE
jgi:GMP synthase (glutamine-hydrolysing)